VVFQLLLVADLAILVATYLRLQEAWANATCVYVYPLCDYPPGLIIAGIVFLMCSILIRS